MPSLSHCADASNQVIREREIESLVEAMGEMSIEDGVVVTMDEEDRLERHGRLIRLVPAWRWLLKVRTGVNSSILSVGGTGGL